MIKDANRKTIREILSKDGNDECLYQIPPYQRAYTWGKSEWEDLFNDLYMNEKGYFLGSLICINQGQGKNEVIDGQQRLTTLSILLISLYSKIQSLKNHCDISREQNKNLVWLEDAIFIDDLQSLRLKPSIQNNNLHDWQHLVGKEFDIQLTTDVKKFRTRKISRAYDFFINLLEQNIITSDQQQSINRLFDFISKINSTNLIKIETDDEQSAFLLFESLNNRGVPLSAIDLIKNKLLSVLPNDIDKNNEEWQVLVKNIGDVPNLQERFLRHFYQIYFHSLPNKKDKHLDISKGNLIKYYAKQIETDAQFIFNELIAKSKIHGLLINPENIEKEDVYFYKYSAKLMDLKYLGISSSYMLLTYLFDKYKDEDFSELLSYLEFWFICRHATNNPATGALDKIFVKLTHQQQDKYDFHLIRKTLDEYLDKDLIKKSLSDLGFYDDSSKLARILLMRLENIQRTQQTATDFWKLTEKGKLVWSIEHIYPQKPKSELDWGSGEDIKLLKEKLHSLGNLTLTCYNSSYSNKKYADKCQVQDGEKLVGLINGDVKINQTLPEPSSAENTWTADKIDERTEWLINNFVSFLDKD